MKNWKKVGLTALAGSLVTTSAFAGAVTVSGTANLTYTANGGAQDTAVTDSTNLGHDGARWGLNKSLSFSGSGELDNGWTVSVSQTLADGGSTGIGMTIDMGDAGSLNYEVDNSQRGIGKIKDMMPTADEDVGNGIDVDGTGTAGGLSGTVAGGTSGFHYSKAMDIVEFGIGYAPKGGSTNSPGGVSGTGGTASTVSGFIKIDPMDGLEVGFGVGQVSQTTTSDAGATNDHTTVYVTYVYGPLTAGFQRSDIETVGSTVDDEQTRWALLYAVNDEMSISYQDHSNDDGTATDESATGWSASYTSGGMTFKLHRNSADNVGNAANKESEHTEVGVTFAF